MTLKFSIPIGKFEKCFACGEVFGEDEPRTIVVYAGSAWKNGGAELVEGAEMFRSCAFHERDAPSESSGEKR